MYITEFPECCGAKVLIGFNPIGTSTSASIIGNRHIASQLRDYTRDNAFIFAVLTADQKKFWDPLLKKHGFRAAPMATNPKTGNRLTAYVLVVTAAVRKKYPR